LEVKGWRQHEVHSMSIQMHVFADKGVILYDIRCDFAEVNPPLLSFFTVINVIDLLVVITNLGLV